MKEIVYKIYAGNKILLAVATEFINNNVCFEFYNGRTSGTNYVVFSSNLTHDELKESINSILCDDDKYNFKIFD